MLVYFTLYCIFLTELFARAERKRETNWISAYFFFLSELHSCIGTKPIYEKKYPLFNLTECNFDIVYFVTH